MACEMTHRQIRRGKKGRGCERGRKHGRSRWQVSGVKVQLGLGVGAGAFAGAGVGEELGTGSTSEPEIERQEVSVGNWGTTAMANTDGGVEPPAQEGRSKAHTGTSAVSAVMMVVAMARGGKNRSSFVAKMEQALAGDAVADACDVRACAGCVWHLSAWL
eukprot:6209037-Pleurochrysis_carterae.AAC.2